MSAASIVLLAVVGGELATTDATDAVLVQMAPSRHHDPTWTELTDALLDQRNSIRVSTWKRVPALSR